MSVLALACLAVVCLFSGVGCLMVWIVYTDIRSAIQRLYADMSVSRSIAELFEDGERNRLGQKIGITTVRGIIDTIHQFVNTT